jgi:hypothetical protein
VHCEPVFPVSKTGGSVHNQITILKLGATTGRIISQGTEKDILLLLFALIGIIDFRMGSTEHNLIESRVLLIAGFYHTPSMPAVKV